MYTYGALCCVVCRLVVAKGGGEVEVVETGEGGEEGRDGEGGMSRGSGQIQQCQRAKIPGQRPDIGKTPEENSCRCWFLPE